MGNFRYMYLVLEKNNRIANLWLGLTGYTYFILLWGTFVRASRSGAGCGQSWPKCEGSFLFDINNIAQIIEYFHRATSGIYGILALGLVVYTIKKRGFGKYGALCLGFLFFVFLEAWIGRMLVIKEYVVDDQRTARLIWMGLHFLNTLVLATSLILIWMQSKSHPGIIVKPVKKTIRYIATSWLALGFLLVSTLGIVTAFYDTTIIKGGQSVEGVSALIGILRNIHPFVAVAYVLTIVYFYVHEQKEKKYFLYLLIANVALGLLNIFYHHVTFLQVAHVFIAHMIWFVLIWMSISAYQQK